MYRRVLGTCHLSDLFCLVLGSDLHELIFGF